jgi:superfamily I DNA and/or RNA helicase
VVLTPYKNQAAMIRSMLRARRGPLQAVEVLNTHRAQGREWDIVVFSAVDGSRPSCFPYFTDSRKDLGRVVINTTLSRVKRRLILVVERRFWTSKPDQLLGRLAALGLPR